MPGAYRLSRLAIANQHRVDRRAEEAFDQGSSHRIGTDEIAQGPEDRALAENRALFEKSRCCRRQTNSLALEAFQRIEFCRQRRVQLVGPRHLKTSRSFALARLSKRHRRIFCSGDGFCGSRCNNTRFVFGGSELATRGLGGIEQRFLFGTQRRESGVELVALTLGSLPIEVGAVELFAKLPKRALPLLQTGARRAQICANIFFMTRVTRERGIGGAHCSFQIDQLGGSAFELGADATGDGVALAALLLGSLATRRRVAQSLLSNRDLATQLLCALTFIGHETGELVAPCFSGGALTECRIAGCFSSAQALVFAWDFSAKQRHSLLELGELVAPG